MPVTTTHAHAPCEAADHDHDRCIADAVAAAAELCERRGARLTDLRRRILELVWRSHAPRGPYSILDTLQQQGRSAAPPTVYRALDFLLAHGLVHRIESLNAVVGCPTPGKAHTGHFLICTGCGIAAEVDDRRIGDAVAASAGKVVFRIERQTSEGAGRCPSGQRP